MRLASFSVTGLFGRFNYRLKLNLTDRITILAPKRIDFAYDSAGRYQTIQRYASTTATSPRGTTTYTYDGLDRITSLQHKTGSNVEVDLLSLAYDAAGRIISRATSSRGVLNEDFAFSYDSRNQLTGADDQSAADEDQAWEYDEAGNRISADGAAYTIGVNNRLDSDGVYDYTYDNDGNMLTRTHIVDGSVREFAWDPRNRLTGIIDRASTGGPVTQAITYTYDAFDNLVSRIFDSNGDSAGGDDKTYYIWDSDQVVMLYHDPDGSGTAQAPALSDRFVWGPGTDFALAAEHFVSGASAAVYWAMVDHQGTVMDIVGDSGLLEARRFDAFGNLMQEVGPSPVYESISTMWGYTGRSSDAASGLQFNRARWYDPSIGRFISEDPIGYEGGDSNLYRYVFNNPLAMIDPSGEAGFGLDLGIFNFYIGDDGIGFGLAGVRFNLNWKDGFSFSAGFHIGLGIEFGPFMAGVGFDAMLSTDLEKSYISGYAGAGISGVGGVYASAYIDGAGNWGGSFGVGLGRSVGFPLGESGWGIGLSAELGYSWTFGENGVRDAGFTGALGGALGDAQGFRGRPLGFGGGVSWNSRSGLDWFAGGTFHVADQLDSLRLADDYKLGIPYGPPSALSAYGAATSVAFGASQRAYEYRRQVEQLQRAAGPVNPRLLSADGTPTPAPAYATPQSQATAVAASNAAVTGEPLYFGFTADQWAAAGNRARGVLNDVGTVAGAYWDAVSKSYTATQTIASGAIAAGQYLATGWNNLQEGLEDLSHWMDAVRSQTENDRASRNSLIFDNTPAVNGGAAPLTIGPQFAISPFANRTFCATCHGDTRGWVNIASGLDKRSIPLDQLLALSVANESAAHLSPVAKTGVLLASSVVGGVGALAVSSFSKAAALGLAWFAADDAITAVRTYAAQDTSIASATNKGIYGWARTLGASEPLANRIAGWGDAGLRLAADVYAGYTALHPGPTLPNNTRGWKVGDPINNLTATGKVPSWDTVRERYWKNEAFYRGDRYDILDGIRMQQGLPPTRINPITGRVERMELHHIPPQREGGRFDVRAVWEAEHRIIDPFRK